MPRNGAGTYTVPNTFLPNTVMSATAVNANFVDAGTELTNSLARDGQSSMSGPLKAIDGTTEAPGIAFGTDTDTGLRRASANEMRWVGGGVDRFYIDSVGRAWYLGDVDIAGDLNVQGTISGAGLDDIEAIEALSGVGLLRRDGDADWALDPGPACITIMRDGYGNVIPTGIMGDVAVPFDCTITGVTLLADQTGSIAVDIWKEEAENFPPDDGDSITASAPPTISADDHSEEAALPAARTHRMAELVALAVPVGNGRPRDQVAEVVPERTILTMDPIIIAPRAGTAVSMAVAVAALGPPAVACRRPTAPAAPALKASSSSRTTAVVAAVQMWASIGALSLSRASISGQRPSIASTRARSCFTRARSRAETWRAPTCLIPCNTSPASRAAIRRLWLAARSRSTASPSAAMTMWSRRAIRRSVPSMLSTGSPARRTRAQPSSS